MDTNNAVQIRTGDRVRLVRRPNQAMIPQTAFEDYLATFDELSVGEDGTVGEVTATYTTGFLTFQFGDNVLDLPKDCFDLVEQ